MDSPYVEGDHLLSLLNVGALEAAMDGLDEEAIRNTASVLSTLAYALKRYIDLGKVPVRVQHLDVVGVLTDGNWLFFMPGTGVVMRCNASCSVGSQMFEVLTGYLDMVRDLISGEPWWDRSIFLGTTMDGLAPPVPPFWALHVKTAEVI
ncbi:hypothetical protein CO724_17200 [Ectopseudomonas mendocina]|nr:hypothetical protein CO724_17200 [Pseudomonas mendocina]